METAADLYDPAYLSSDHRALWERVVGEASPVFTRLYMFPYRFYPADGPAKTDHPRLLRMNMGSWRHSLLRAYDERLRFRKASGDIFRVLETVDIPDIPPFVRGHPVRRDLHYLHYHCIATTENFYTALKQLSDRIALTVLWYFGEPMSTTRKGAHHRMLKERFKSLHGRIAGTKAPHQLKRQIESLNAHR